MRSAELPEQLCSQGEALAQPSSEDSHAFSRLSQPLWGALENSALTPQFMKIVDCKGFNDASLAEETSFRELTDSAPVLIWVADANQNCNYFNRGWLDFTGRALEQEIGSGWTDGLFPEDREQVAFAYRQAFATRERFEIEYRLRRHDGRYRWLLAAGVPKYSSDGQFAGYIGSCVDITDRKHAQIKLEQLLAASDEAHVQLTAQTQRLHRLAESDPLTGLLNRRSFREQFELEWRRSTRHDRPLACVMLDVDFFKKVNDTHGHAAGDAILKHLAETLLNQCRPNDVICRYGGEEFCIMVPETTESGAATLAERLRSVLAKTCFDTDGQLHSVTSSFGVAERLGDMHDIDELIHRADHALRIAKLSGRNRVVRFSSGEANSETLSVGSPARILSEVAAGDLMVATPCVASDETIEQAVEVLLRHDAGSAPVVDSQGLLVGLVSQRDLMTIDVSRGSWSSPVREVMRTNVVCYDENSPGHQVFQFLCRVSIHQVVVLRNNRPIGVISPSSLLAFFQERVIAEPEACLTLD